MGEKQNQPFQLSLHPLVESCHLARRLFGNMLRGVAALPLPTGEVWLAKQ